MTKAGRRLSIYEEVAESEADDWLDSLSDEEADRLLAQLEAAHARFLATTYRFWPRRRQYAFDRASGLCDCLRLRRLLAQATEGFEGLTGDELAYFVRRQHKALKASQIDLLRIRSSFLHGVSAGSA